MFSHFLISYFSVSYFLFSIPVPDHTHARLRVCID
ncbi:MAG: hypothetical protein RLZZ429_1253 [Bacteroidota bacterium]|jgi:hypothetical protein